MGDTDSDDSESEGGQGNVSRVVIRPHGHSGKAKKGHLCFDAAFETGNLGRVDLINEFEYDLFIRPDTCNPRYRGWFHFTVDNIRPDQRVIFNIVNISKKKNNLLDGMTPIVKSTSRPKWQRIPRHLVYYHRSAAHRNQYVLSFAFAFDREEEVYHFALCRPYSYSRAQMHLELLERKRLPHVRRDLLAHSVQQRRADLITITSPKNMELPLGVRIVVFLCRSHPGEPSSSFVCQGLIDFLSGAHPIAILLRKYIVFKVVPMLNPDGVFMGNQRCSLLGFDLNRAWQDAPPFSHPTIDAMINLLTEWNGRQDVHLDFVVDMHGHNAIHGAFIYGNWYDDVYRFERHILYPKLLSQNAEDFNSADTLYNRDPLKAGTARRYLCNALKDSVNCYSLFASIHGYHRPGHPNFLTYSDEIYFRLGRNIARTFVDYYRMTGIIPQTIPASVTPKTGMSTRRRRIRCRRSRKRRHTSTMTSPGPLPSGQRRMASGTSGMSGGPSSGDEGFCSSPYSGAGSPTMMPKPLRLRALSIPPPTSTTSQQPPVPPQGLPLGLGLGLGPNPITSRAFFVRNPCSGLRAQRKVGGGDLVASKVVVTSSLPPPSPPPAPSLSIIDMNERASGGLPPRTSSPSPSLPPATPGHKARAPKRATFLRHTYRGKME